MVVMASRRNLSDNAPKLLPGDLTQMKCSPKEDPQGERQGIEERPDSSTVFHGASHD